MMNFRKFYYSASGSVDEIVDNIFTEYKEHIKIRNRKLESDYRTVLKIIVCNLIFAVKSNTEYISISLNKNNYLRHIRKYEPTNITYTVFKNLILWLANNSYIDLYKARSNPSGGISTVIKPLDTLIETVNDYEIKYYDVAIHPEYAYITVKDSNKSLIDYVDNEETLHRTSILKSYNKLLNEQEIIIANKLISYPIAVESKYNYAVGKNGRIYGGEWMNCKSELRSAIKINGKATKEIDISNCSLRLAGHLNNKLIPDNIDLYSMDGIDRDTVKQIGTVMLNTDIPKTHKQGIENVTKTVFNKKVKEVKKEIAINGNLTIKDTESKISKHISIINNNQNNIDVLSSYGFKWTRSELKEYVKKVYEYFKLFADGWLMSGRGLELQHKDSVICFKVIEKFLAMNKVVLTVHDSFITVEEDIELLKDVIVASYKEVVGDRHTPLLK
ncbi:hypothetical protein [Aliarcobacter cryaerophilus]|uniref:hypothetical protein n=1 Tax=Aliarcobacter cryaerophilus TaxID=28198 RepID=UPI003DA61822